MRSVLFGMIAVLSAPTVAAQSAAPRPAGEGRVTRYHVTIKDVKYVYGVAPPVARVRSGSVVETNTLDAAGNALQEPGDTLALAKGYNPLTGPFFIEDAEPGDYV